MVVAVTLLQLVSACNGEGTPWHLAWMSAVRLTALTGAKVLQPSSVSAMLADDLTVGRLCLQPGALAPMCTKVSPSFTSSRQGLICFSAIHVQPLPGLLPNFASHAGLTIHDIVLCGRNDMALSINGISGPAEGARDTQTVWDANSQACHHALSVRAAYMLPTRKECSSSWLHFLMFCGDEHIRLLCGC